MGSLTFEYHCRILEWLDGDTCKIEIDLGFNITRKETCRIYGLNTAELHTSDQLEKIKGTQQKEFAAKLCPIGCDVKIKSFKPNDPMDKYGRWLVSITLQNGKDFATEMLANKMGVAYFGGKR